VKAAQGLYNLKASFLSPPIVLVVVVVLVIDPFLSSLLSKYYAQGKPQKTDYDDEDEDDSCLKPL